MRAGSPLILPVGTQIVTRRGDRGHNGSTCTDARGGRNSPESTGDATHTYRVRFVNGGEASLLRGEFSVRKEFQQAGLHEAAETLDDMNLERFVIFRCVIGSRQYGLDNSESDVDRRGIYLPPAELHWSLFGLPEQLENEARRRSAIGSSASFSYWRSKPIPTCWSACIRRSSNSPRRWPANCSTCAMRSSRGSSTRLTTATSYHNSENWSRTCGHAVRSSGNMPCT